MALQVTLLDRWGDKKMVNPMQQDSGATVEKDDWNDVDDTFLCLGAGTMDTEITRPAQSVPSDADFDMNAGRTWIYPSNVPLRKYQAKISEKAFYYNTLVTLPTGLGKTLIAAVVMYNFYRWFPGKKVVLMAPTRPLVAQQLEACRTIMGIPKEYVSEMTGSKDPESRREEWMQKRIFFLTPQVLLNDLARLAVPAVNIKCLVVDEAHRATGNHAYCEVIRELLKYEGKFRVLALSATPGQSTKAVQEVISNLLIAHLEIRADDSDEVKQYTHERIIEKVVVPMDSAISALIKQYAGVLEAFINVLIRERALYVRSIEYYSKFRFLQERERFRSKPEYSSTNQTCKIVENAFAMVISLYHGFELVRMHSTKSLYRYITEKCLEDTGSLGSQLKKNSEFMELYQKLSDLLQRCETSMCTQRQVVQAQLLEYGTLEWDRRLQETVAIAQCYHPKMVKLIDILVNHFSSHIEDQTSTRVIVFASYRDSVTEIAQLLNNLRPLVKPMKFVGQGGRPGTKRVSQKKQLEVIKKFQTGGYNTLVATCVGEEGLDIGEVDLIVCYDATSSPVRLVQRLGRTGRKRNGKIMVLVTQGREEHIQYQSEDRKKFIHKAISAKAESFVLYNANPRLLPSGVKPVQVSVDLSLKKFTDDQPAATSYLKSIFISFGRPFIVLSKNLVRPAGVSRTPLFEWSVSVVKNSSLWLKRSAMGRFYTDRCAKQATLTSRRYKVMKADETEIQRYNSNNWVLPKFEEKTWAVCNCFHELPMANDFSVWLMKLSNALDKGLKKHCGYELRNTSIGIVGTGDSFEGRRDQYKSMMDGLSQRICEIVDAQTEHKCDNSEIVDTSIAIAAISDNHWNSQKSSKSEFSLTAEFDEAFHAFSEETVAGKIEREVFENAVENATCEESSTLRLGLDETFPFDATKVVFVEEDQDELKSSEIVLDSSLDSPLASALTASAARALTEYSEEEENSGPVFLKSDNSSEIHGVRLNKRESTMGSFIWSQAVVSGTDSGDEEEVSSDCDESLDNSFVEQSSQVEFLTQNPPSNTQMRGIYLNSLNRSFGNASTGIKFTSNAKADENIYMTTDGESEQSSDLCDSFVVPNDYIEYEEDSPVQKKKRSEKRIMNHKRRRVVMYSSSESENETNKPSCSTSCGPLVKPFYPGQKSLKGLPVAVVRPCQSSSAEPSDALERAGKSSEKPIIIVGAHTLATSQHMVSTLRTAFEVDAYVHSLSGYDYLIGSRVVVRREYFSDFSKPQKNFQIRRKVFELVGSYERVVMLLQKDRLKSVLSARATDVHCLQYNKAVSKTLHSFAQELRIDVFFADGVEDCASILAQLAYREMLHGHHITCDLNLTAIETQILNFYMKIPGVTYVSSLHLVKSFPSIQAVMYSSHDELQLKGKMKKHQAELFYSFIRRAVISSQS